MLFDLSNITDQARFNTKIAVLKSKGATVDLTEKRESRTLKQNNAIHLYCEMVADMLNDMGATLNYTGIKGVQMEIKYTMILVKETIWKPLQMALFEKESTTELTRGEVSEVAEQIERFFALRGVDLPFPSIENMM